MLKQALVAALMLSLAAFALADEPLTGEDRQAVQQVIRGQIAAFESDDPGAAYAFAAPSVREVFPTEEMFISINTSPVTFILKSLGKPIFIYFL